MAIIKIRQVHRVQFAWFRSLLFVILAGDSLSGGGGQMSIHAAGRAPVVERARGNVGGGRGRARACRAAAAAAHRWRRPRANAGPVACTALRAAI